MKADLFPAQLTGTSCNVSSREVSRARSPDNIANSASCQLLTLARVTWMFAGRQYSAREWVQQEPPEACPLETGPVVKL